MSQALPRTESNVSEYEMDMGAYSIGTSVKSGSRGSSRKASKSRKKSVDSDSLALSGSESDPDDNSNANDGAIRRRESQHPNDAPFGGSNGGDEMDDLFIQQQYSPSRSRPENKFSPKKQQQGAEAFNFDEGSQSDEPFFPANKKKTDAQQREDLAALRAKARPQPPRYPKGTPRDSVCSGMSSQDTEPPLYSKDSRGIHKERGNANTTPSLPSSVQPSTEERHEDAEDVFMRSQYSSESFDLPSHSKSKKSGHQGPSKVDDDMYKLKEDLYRLRQEDEQDQQGEHEDQHDQHEDQHDQAPMEEWQKVFDDTYQMYYYFNNYTHESTWDIPESFWEAEGWGETNNYMSSALEIISSARSVSSRPPARRPTRQQRDSVLRRLTGHDSNNNSYNPDEGQETPSFNAALNSRVVGKHYVPPKADTEGTQSDSESGEEGSPRPTRLAKGADILTEAYGGIYDVSELLEDEEARLARKFNAMKKSGSIMRTRLGWEEWLSGQGAVFYAQRGQQGGQWEVPAPFARLDQEKKVNEKNKSRLKRLHHKKEEEERSSHYSFMLKGWEEKAEEEEALYGARSGVKSFENADGLLEAGVIRDVFDMRYQQESDTKTNKRPTATHRIKANGDEFEARNYSEQEEIGGEMIDQLDNKESFGKYGNNIRISDRYAGKLNEITAGMKEVYRALRTRDSHIDVSVNAAELEERTEKAKQRWQQYVEMKEERNKALFGNEEDEEDDDDNQMDFTKLYSRSVIVRQRWPWTKLVDIQSEKVFYRNEQGDYFQFEVPPEFESEVEVPGSELRRHDASATAASKSQGDGSKVAVVDRRRRGLLASSMAAADSTEKDKAAAEKSQKSLEVDERTILRGNFNIELLQRREHLLAVHRKQRQEELEKSQAPGSSIKASDRRLKSSRVVTGAYRRQSVFRPPGERGSLKAFLEEFAPPKGVELSPRSAKEEWKNLSDLESGKTQESFDIGWHDAVSLISRLRRFSELKRYAESVEDGLSPLRAHRPERETGPATINPLESPSRLAEIRDGSSLLRPTESTLVRAAGEHSLTNSQSFANQTLMMESRGEPFVCSNTQFSFRNSRKIREDKLQELDRTAAMRRLAAHHKKRSYNEMKAAVSVLAHYLDTYESTFFETEIIRRHLLEAAVMLRFCQSAPVRKRDAKAYLGLPMHCIAANAMKGNDVMRLAKADADQDQRKWKMYTFSRNEFGNSMRPNPDDLFTIYVHNKTDRAQVGVPFDLKLRDWKDNELKVLRWYKHGKVYDASRKSRKAVTLLADKFRGVLFHCPIRRVFDWKEQMDYSYYDIPPPKKPQKKLTEAALRMTSDSDSDSDSEANLISEKKKRLKEKLEAMAAASEKPVKEGKSARVYKTQAMEEHRSLNIWEDLNMTKSSKDRHMSSVRNKRLGGGRGKVVGFSSGSSVLEESMESTTTSALNPALSVTRVKTAPMAFSKALNCPDERHGKLKDYYDPDKVLTRKFLDYFEGILLANPASPPFVVDVRKPQRPQYSPQDEKDQDPLEFEDELCQEDYAIYYDLIFDVYENPDHVPCLVALATFLLRHGLGRETFIVFVRILEVSYDSQYSSNEDLAFVVLSLCNLSCKYMQDFRVSHVLADVCHMCPENPLVLGMSARLYHKLKLLDKAEELYIGALLLDPECSVSLRGYALLLTEKGNHAAAGRYLARVDEGATHFATAKVEYGWIQELTGARDDVLQLDYQAVLGAGLKTRESTLALAALGHFFHVRGDATRAKAYYNRCLHQNPDNSYCLLLSSCLRATEIGQRKVLQPTTATVVERTSGGNITHVLSAVEEDEAIDAQFRRGLFFMQSPNSNRWVGLLAYAEFVANRLQDCKRAEDIYWEAARLSCKYAVWAVIALAHFYQYMWDDCAKAKKLMLWAAKKRTVPIVRETEDEGYIDENDEDIFLRPEDKDQKKRAEENSTVLKTLKSENACLFAANASICADLNEHKECLEFIKKSLQCDKKNSAAYRIWGLLDWKQGKKHEAILKFEKSLSFAPYNPFALRTYSVACAIMGLYDEAVGAMQQAVEISGMSHPLACRACGIMTYLYQERGGKERSLGYFQKALDMSGGMDFEAGRLKAQVLMELGRFQKAVDTLLQVLPLKPTDSIALGSLAVCMSALGHEAPRGAAKVNYSIKIKLLAVPQELLQSTDPEELFEAATTFNLGQTFLQKSGKGKGALLAKGWGILNNMAVDEPLDFLEAHDNDVPPIVLYWYGMHELRKGGQEAIKKSRALFLRATQRQDYPPHLLSLHKLGWIAEMRRDLRAAERYYCAGLQQDPIDPYAFLQLTKLVGDTHAFVHRLKGRSYGGPGSDLERATSLQAQFESEQVEKGQPRASKGARKKPKKLAKKSPAPVEHVEPSADDIALDAITLKQRKLLHERVKKLAALRTQQMKGHLEGMIMPGAFVYLEPMWLEQYMVSFSDCDDWAWLLKTSINFRKLTNEKKKANREVSKF